MSDVKIGVFPGTGGLGGSTVKHLLNVVNPSSVIAIVRKPENVPNQIISTGLSVRAADYDVDSTLSNAFDSISTLNLISYPSFDHRHRVHVHKLAIDAAHKSGVKHIFYSSLAFAGDGNTTSAAQVMQAHLDTEKYLALVAAKDPSFTYTAVRIGLYSESFPIYTAFFDLNNPTTEVKIPHNGSGPGIAWAKREELGNAVALLMKSYSENPRDFEYVNKTILLSGPRVWSLQETVEALGKAVKKPVKLVEVSVDEYAAQPLVQKGLVHEAGTAAAVWATAFDGIREGETAVSSPNLAKILGREPESFDKTIASMVLA